MIKKEEKRKTFIIILLLLCIIGMAIGYASLSQTLNVTGAVHTSSDWNIRITNAVRSSGNGSTDNINSPSFIATDVSFDVNLVNPGATATYKITIKNDGKIPAKLNNINGIEIANQTQPIELQFSTNARVGDVLLAGESIDYIITVIWDIESHGIPQVKSKTVTVQFEYIQNI